MTTPTYDLSIPIPKWTNDQLLAYVEANGNPSFVLSAVALELARRTAPTSVAIVIECDEYDGVARQFVQGVFLTKDKAAEWVKKRPPLKNSLSSRKNCYIIDEMEISE